MRDILSPPSVTSPLTPSNRMSSKNADPAVGAYPEKEGIFSAVEDGETNNNQAAGGTHLPPRMAAYVRRVENRLAQYSLETRGIQRVQEDERMKKLSWISYSQAFLLWVSINLAPNNITLGMLGPAVYGLSFLDSALCAVLGAFVGSIAAAWMATWGPVSGVRTMVWISLPCEFNDMCLLVLGSWAVLHGLVAQ